MLAAAHPRSERREKSLYAPFYRCYKTADDKFLSVGPIESQFFAEFVRLAGLDDGLCKIQNNKAEWPAMCKLIEERLAEKTRDEWAAIFEGSDACVAPVLTFEEAASYPANVQRNVFFESDGVKQVTPVPRFSRTTPTGPERAGETGSDGSGVLSEAGFDAEQIEILRQDGVLL